MVVFDTAPGASRQLHLWTIHLVPSLASVPGTQLGSESSFDGFRQIVPISSTNDDNKGQRETPPNASQIPIKSLNQQDLESLRILFPRAIGAQLLITGFLRMLFDSTAEVERTYNLGYPGEVGGLIVLLDTAKFSAIAQKIESGAAVSDTEIMRLV
ncbi:hypothetical protein N7516_008384 [Penicillium verrucosum]|uniref:uncharacterized protein n=1 Tax=Penicillium verrucosum TaxID=60171 RepID=UPI002544F21E|nr:uncharacterized protein N7516_008384 [Penicillium verrucosum]KAJ5926611.1 hypothetical protein N7516_008384 [Penicillium verrucosum]